MTPPVDPTSAAASPPSVERRVPLVVVGAGPAGAAAAIEAARAGVRVLLVDEHPVDFDTMALDVPLYFGQRMAPAARNRALMLARVVETNPALAEADAARVEVLPGTSVWGAFRNGPTVRALDGPMVGLADLARSWLVGYDRLIVAAGARDVVIGFPGWEKAGVMGAHAAATLLTRYRALAARRMVVVGSGPAALATAALALEAGVEVAAVVEVEAEIRGDARLHRDLERRGVRFHVSHTVKEARGATGEVEAIVLVRVDPDLRPVPGTETEIACDTVCLGLGLVPQVELPALLGCRLAFHAELGGFVPETDAWMRTSVPDVFVAGDAAGLRGLAAEEGRRAGLAAAAALGAVGWAEAEARLGGTAPPRSIGLPETHRDWQRWLRSLVNAGGEDVTVCQCEEVTRRELADLAPPRYLGWRSPRMSARTLHGLAGDGPVSPDQVKRLTRTGMGPCQGRRCREQVALFLAERTGTPVADIPPASFRPPVRPLPLATLWPHDEPAEVRHHWVSWFSIPTQFAPHWKPDLPPAAPPAVARLSRRGDGQATGAGVVIVGGGVTGLSAGWWLARAGADVVVLERGIVGWEASGRNGGGATHVYSPLGLEEQRLWPQMDELLGYPTEHAPHRIKIALDEAQLALYRRNAEIAAARGFPSEPLDARQVRELVPIAGDGVAGGVYLRFGGHANPQRTVQAYAWALQDHGGRLLQHTTVSGFRIAGGRVTAVETDRGVFGADVVVLAAGPQTALLAARAGVHVPLAPARVEMIVTEPLPLMGVGGVDGNGLYGRQTRRGNLVYGGGPHEWIDVEGLAAPEQPATPLLRNLGRRLAELFPGAAHLRLIRSWAGVVENTPDGLPILDRVASPENLVVATMSSVGFGLSPASGKAISELVLHGRCLFADLDPLRLDRFARTPPDWRARQGWLAAPGPSRMG